MKKAIKRFCKMFIIAFPIVIIVNIAIILCWGYVEWETPIRIIYENHKDIRVINIISLIAAIIYSLIFTDIE